MNPESSILSDTALETAASYSLPIIAPLGDIATSALGSRPVGVYDVYNGHVRDISGSYTAPAITPIGEV